MLAEEKHADLLIRSLRVELEQADAKNPVKHDPIAIAGGRGKNNANAVRVSVTEKTLTWKIWVGTIAAATCHLYQITYIH